IVGKDGRDLGGGRNVLDVNLQRGVQVAHAGRTAAAARALTRSLREGLAEYLAEYVGARKRIATCGAEFEMLRAAGAALGTAEAAEGIAALRAFEALEARLALGVDLAAV